MFFIYRTRYVIGQATYDQETQQLGRMFIHDTAKDVESHDSGSNAENGRWFVRDTGKHENKVCLFGKIVAMCAIVCAFIRLYVVSSSEHASYIKATTIFFSLVCAVAAFNMNLTAFIYIVPLLVVELLWVCMLSN